MEGLSQTTAITTKGVIHNVDVVSFEHAQRPLHLPSLPRNYCSFDDSSVSGAAGFPKFVGAYALFSLIFAPRR
jgi:hypothetical protein